MWQSLLVLFACVFLHPVFCAYCLKFLKICFSFPGNKVVKEEGCKTGIAINFGFGGQLLQQCF